MRLFEGGGGLVGGRGRLPGLGGVGGSCGGSSLSSLGKTAGRNLAMFMLSVGAPGIATLNESCCRLMTRYGPTYGVASVG